MTAYERRISDWSSDVCSSDLVRGSPRFNRALPPRAATTSMSGSQGGDQHRLDGVHAVFRLIKNDRGGAFENLVRDFHGVDTEFLLNLLKYGSASCRERVCQFV